jgi:Ring finger domain
MSSNQECLSPSEEVLTSLVKLSSTVFEQRGSQNENDACVTISEGHLAFEDRCQIEEEKSLELARQLMAEEAMYSYQQHIELLRDSAYEYSSEDLDAFRAALGEDQYVPDDFAHGPDTGESYETMLLLGERIGDVKAERWNIVAAKEINKLTTFPFDLSNTIDRTHAALHDSENKCLVCQCQYQLNETLIQLPCNHCFHHECASQWLQNKDTCPYCRQSITMS